jgi:ectoine hydroxylase-related dioxygenase (phytanoyl-CoA dioxygenase family)
MRSSKFIEFSRRGFIVQRFAAIRELTQFVSGLDVDNLVSLTDDRAFRLSVLEAQTTFNDGKLHHLIFHALKETIIDVARSSKLLISGVAFLRVVRPQTQSLKFEYLDFHRESFYGSGDFVKHQINVHVPLCNYTDRSSVKYVPGSHKIPEHQFVVDTIPESETGFKRGSVEHLNGLMYQPKLILSGCNLDSALGFPVRVGEAAIFSSELIHGGGVNLLPRPRVSIDFAVIVADRVPQQLNFQLAASRQGGKEGGNKYVPIRAEADSPDF